MYLISLITFYLFLGYYCFNYPNNINYNNVTIEKYPFVNRINSDEEDEKYDPNNVKKRGQGPKISVKKANKW
jgi:hypothetical protein